MARYLTQALHKLVARMDAAADGILLEHVGIGFEAARVLMVLRAEQPCSQRWLAGCLGVTPSAITRSLPSFILSGRVHITVDPRQPRRNLLTLTDSGQQLADDCWRTLEHEFACLLEASGLRVDAFLSQVEVINAALDAHPLTKEKLS